MFTCASTRAVHLELTHDMGEDLFLLAIRRFASRRGLPVTLMSDNAKTFQSSAKELIKISRSKEMNQYLTNNRITWKFIVEGTMLGKVLGEDGSRSKEMSLKDHWTQLPDL